jgi:hypothetical protein
MAMILAADPDHRERPTLSSLAIAPGDASALPPVVTGSKPLTRRLRQHLWQKTGCALLSLDGQPRLLLDFVHDHGTPLAMNVGASTTSLARVLGEGFGRIVMQELRPERFEALTKHQFHQPLRPILWQIAQHGGDWDDLDRRLLRHARIRLLRWPDFRLLAHQHDGFRLCSLLLKRACSVDECRQLLDLDAITVQAFVRSAYLCGYATVETPEGVGVAASTRSSVHTGSLLARMWRNLRGTAT